ncbi:MAG: GGDEF domain-containing protein [Oscillospiraceae bacterium]|nr:GGDEF domain-containing protein [Oscillospiraceae bacterium]
MSKRKIIAAIMAYPESEYQQRTLDGLCSACSLYGYDLAVFTMLVLSGHFYKDYLEGERNIYELINFNEFDGVYIDAVSLIENNDHYLLDYIVEKARKNCTKPVISTDFKLDGYDCISNNDDASIAVITAHVLDVHKVDPKKVLFLTGSKGNDVAMHRLKGITEEYAKRGLTLEEEQIVWGDFWYSGGHDLADRIISGETERPQAVICASDHMAMGLIRALMKAGIDVPGDIIVTGYDSTTEGILDNVSLTSYIPDTGITVHKAISRLVEQIEPGRELLPPAHFDTGLCVSASCGCGENIMVTKERIRSQLITTHRDYTDPDFLDKADLAMLLDSYDFERYTGTRGVESGIREIYGTDWLIRPYKNMWLCLCPDWLNTDKKQLHGYPPKMNIAIHTVPTPSFQIDDIQHYTVRNDHLFDTSLMLPALKEEHDPSVFYFTPIHFSTETLGYCVVQCDIHQKKKPGIVFHNWARNVNNALELIRSRNMLESLAVRDEMTGLMNRRGMDFALRRLYSTPNASALLAIVIDLDGLKKINDEYGHNEGDFAIKAVARMAERIALPGEFCIRAGGDEFYIIGCDIYDDELLNLRVKKFHQLLSDYAAEFDKPYDIYASVGYAMGNISDGIDNVISTADERMYSEKTKNKRQRI